MLENTDYLMQFGSPHRAMKAERILKKARLPIALIPAPAGLGQGCSLAIRLPAEVHVAVLAVLVEAGMEPNKTFRQTPSGLVPV